MKNAKRITVVLAVAMLICTLCLSLVACNPAPDPETRPFSMSISQPDGVFNPFFSTSAYDSSVISLTQIGMLNTDKEGNITYGENEPTVAKDFNVIENKVGSETVTTTYEFLIKKGIKWSDGKDLTVKDVLFSLYVYLDPAYTGSATIYSTDIVGLQNYRLQQQGSISDEAVSNFESQFIAAASRRVTDLIAYVGWKGSYKGTSTNPKPTEDDLSNKFDEDEAIEDIAAIAKEFYNELSSDWNAINVDDYKDWDGFEERWQIFFLNDGSMTELLETEPGSSIYVKDENGNFKMNREEAQSIYNLTIKPELDKLYQNGTLNTSDSKYQEKLDEAMKNICVNSIFELYFPDFLEKVFSKANGGFELTNKNYTENVKECLSGLGYSEFGEVMGGWGTASTMFDRFRADEKSKVLAGSDKLVPNITGIRVEQRTSFKGKGMDEAYELDGTYDVLTITINKVDPKAEYNFAFTVSPMHYYSGSWNNVSYIDKANADFEANGYGENQSEFGVAFGDSKFMNEVVNASSKIRLPKGAGPYMASSEKGGAANNGAEFYTSNMVYYERNPYFYTVGEGIENAKIKMVRYKVVASDQIINSLTRGDIDFGDPGATPNNLEVVRNSNLEYMPITTSGYGYVGINPRFVPDVTVRRIIMSAMNKQLIIDDYYEDLADLICRPISMASWAYPWDENERTFTSSDGFSYAYSSLGRVTINGHEMSIEDALEDAGYTKGADGVYTRYIPGFGDDKLDYKFTIAGGSTDHPAYSMFLRAQTILNSHGFNVKVVTSQTALTDLSAGKLEVWAAAWSSTIDPDMYQTYHMESQASSVKNWGYSQIIGRKDSAAWSDEYDIIVELSGKIDEGRETTDQNERKGIYAEALDLIMELACEFPTYQRNDLFAYKKGLLDPSTVPTKDECSAYSSVLSRIWEINYVK